MLGSERGLVQERSVGRCNVSRFLILLLLAGMTGCVDYEGVTSIRRIDDDAGIVIAEDTWYGLSCDVSPDDTTKAREEFADLMQTWLDDKVGVGFAREHRGYLSERRLWVEGGVLRGMWRVVFDADDYFDKNDDGWSADSSGFYLERRSDVVATDGTSVGKERWRWPPEARVMTVTVGGTPGPWRSSFVAWYQAYVAEHGLDEYGRKIGAEVPETGK